MLFVDGLGMGQPDAAINPLFRGDCPVLAGLLRTAAFPVDATLGVPGVPQSATGTTTLLTGLNAALIAGRHVEGFPGPMLREALSSENIFLKLRAAGLACAFANAYGAGSLEEASSGRRLSATTVAVLTGIGRLRLLDDLLAGRAVYHDLTREELRERGFAVPLISPEEAATHLAGIACEHDFTLFEYFQTDRAGHASDPDRKKKVLSLFDLFLATVLRLGSSRGFSVILTSDHGNIEDGLSAAHTMNPVPFIAVEAAGRGPEGAACFSWRDRIRSLSDVAPAILDFLQPADADSLNGKGEYCGV